MTLIETSLSHTLLVNPDRVADIDRRTIEAGTPGQVLMERAGAACTRVIQGRWPRRPVVVLAGPGNNGGDGWVIARRLHEEGWPVTVVSDWPAANLKGDAREAALRARMTPQPLAALDLSGQPLVVDALFGAGLARDLEGEVRAVIEKVAAAGVPVLAVDLPSGLDGRTGAIRGVAPKAEATVTFEVAKPGHLLGAGLTSCGDLHILPIGLDLRADDADALRNGPALWRDALPLPPSAAHKYARGAVLAVAGPRHAGGAIRLAARAAAVSGAGAVTVAATPSAADIHAAHLDAIMVRIFRDEKELQELASSEKVRAVVVGPGLGTDEKAAARLDAVVAADRAMVLDADALTILAGREEPYADLPAGTVLTPHEGEFARLFPDLEGSALDRAQAAADRSGATVLLKGAVTVIATPGEKPILNAHATPYLATAGSGDVLAGIISGLRAQGVPAHSAAAAAAWLHGEAGRRGGPGLTADDLPSSLREALSALA